MAATSAAVQSDKRITRDLPGPGGKPLLGWRGNILPLLRKPIEYMEWLNHTYGDVVALTRGSSEFVFVFSPEYNHQVLSDQMKFFNGAVNAPGSPVKIPEGSSAYRMFSGITTRNAAQHTQQRRLLMPAFHKKRIEALRDEMVALTERHIAGWKAGQEVDILHEMKGLTLAVAVKTILGLDPEREGDHVRRLMEEWLRMTLSPWVIAAPYNMPGSPFHRMLVSAEKLEGEIKEMIARRRAAGNLSESKDALSLLLEAHDEDGTRLTDDELIGHTTALFIAGHETTASALTWTLFLLDQHPIVLRDLLDEMDEVLGGEAPTVENMGGLKLLDNIIKESMRLLPPGLWFLRVATEDTRFGEYDVPEGTRILWTPAVTHRRPELYPQPKKFIPERWETFDPSPYEYLPFGAGPRRCLGATFAMTEMKVVLPILLQKYRLALRPGAKIELGGSPLATPRFGMPMQILGRGKSPAKAQVEGNIHKLVDLS